VTTATAKKPSVQEALAAVMAELPGIGKENNSPEGYAYRGIEAVTKHLQPLLAKHGIVIVPKAQVLATVPSPAMKEGWQDVLMEVTWTIYGPDGNTVEAVTNGIGRDRSDKGANKAQTQAYKYLLLHLFCIADTKDDSDGQTYEHDRRDAPPAEPMATPEQVAEFNAAKDELGEEQQASLRAWFKLHRVPAPAKATHAQIVEAITAARGLHSQGGTVEPDPEPDGEQEELPV
jgi:hypothetical protein